MAVERRSGRKLIRRWDVHPLAFNSKGEIQFDLDVYYRVDIEIIGLFSREFEVKKVRLHELTWKKTSDNEEVKEELINMLFEAKDNEISGMKAIYHFGRCMNDDVKRVLVRVESLARELYDDDCLTYPTIE